MTLDSCKEKLPEPKEESIKITDVSTNLNSLNDYDAKDGKGLYSTFATTINYTSNMDLPKHYTELHWGIRVPGSISKNEGFYQISESNLSANQVKNANYYLMFGNNSYLEITNQIKIYEKTSAGQKGALIKESNVFEFNINKPANANRVGVEGGMLY
jgi:hypothetical protein